MWQEPAAKNKLWLSNQPRNPEPQSPNPKPRTKPQTQALNKKKLYVISIIMKLQSSLSKRAGSTQSPLIQTVPGGHMVNFLQQGLKDVQFASARLQRPEEAPKHQKKTQKQQLSPSTRPQPAQNSGPEPYTISIHPKSRTQPYIPNPAVALIEGLKRDEGPCLGM